MRLIKKYFLGSCILLAFGLFSCEEEATNTNAEKASYQQKNAENFSKEVNLSQNKSVRLLPETEEATNNWMAYITAKNEIERMDRFTLQEVVNNSNNLLRSVQELQDSIPENFDAIPIKARLNVLLTKTYLLEQEAKKKISDAEKVEALSQELYTSFENLKIQLNEVFLKSVEDFEFELDERIRKQDSLAKVEKDTLFQSRIR
jgi:hypothetical protein